MNKQLDNLKIALGLKDDNSWDALLELYLNDARDFLKLRLSLGDDKDLPKSMESIVRGAAVKKFNRFKNEGRSTYSQDGESIAFNKSDFDEWQDEIERWRTDHANVNQGSWINPYEI